MGSVRANVGRTPASPGHEEFLESVGVGPTAILAVLEFAPRGLASMMFCSMHRLSGRLAGVMRIGQLAFVVC